MTNWKTYVEGFYKRDPEHQARLWEKLSTEQKATFLAAYNGGEPSTLEPKPPKPTIDEVLDRLIGTGEVLLSDTKPGGVLRGAIVNSRSFEAWRLECISILRSLGPCVEHLLSIAEHRRNSFANTTSAHKILGALVAAQTISQLQETPEQPTEDPDKTRKESSQVERSVFVVHGHDHAILQRAARLLEQLSLLPIVLFEEPSKGRTIIEKLEQHAACSAALVLLTPDDVGASTSCPENLKPRARQNVVLELGYFLGKLGRNRVIVLYSDRVELPSDYTGVEYIKFDPEGAWRLRIARELRAAGFDIDFNSLT